MANTYTVKKGDTLSEIAERYKSNYGYTNTYTYMNYLVGINNIKNPDVITVGQVIKLSGSAEPTKKTTTSQVTIKLFGLQSNTDRTIYAYWVWSKEHTENYEVYWYYDTGDGIWFVGNHGNVEDSQSLYTAPENAKRVMFKVKPISKKYTQNNKETSYWTGSWSTERIHDFATSPPAKPSVPTIVKDGLKLTVRLDNITSTAKKIEFEVVKDDTSVYKKGTADVNTNSASWSCTLASGSDYKVRCRAVKDALYSDWSDYSDNYGTPPSTPSGITSLKAISETSIYIAWEKVTNAESYDIEYTTKKKYFDGSDQVTTINDIEFTHYEKTGLESGEEYFFRVRAKNQNGDSGWSEIKSVIIGKPPVAPTTWSSTTTLMVGEPLTLYWVHNSEDGSSQTYGELELYIDGVKETHTIKNTTNEDEKDKTSFYTINTSKFVEGSKIQWRVRTAGVTNVYGEWSIQRTIDIYAPPTLELNATDSSGNALSTLTQFPIFVSGLAGPNTQEPIGYHLVVTATEGYETVDNMGDPKLVKAGEHIYSKYFDTKGKLLVELSAGNINLENNITYAITCTVSMNSGLTAESSINFKVAWTDEQYEPNAEIAIDRETFTASIGPYCVNENETLLDDILLSVYRREFDGSYTELARDLNNLERTFVSDPHPALDYARYRIVAKTKATGAVSYFDMPGYPVGGRCVVLQWDEEWVDYTYTNETVADALAKVSWSGSMLKLPYNIDVSDKHKPDVSLVEYIGREHPVSYYGTQIGSSSTWNVEIDKKDAETLYGLRRLSRWMGDVYVREPSGSGYWANVKVSFNQKHREVTIPVTIEITRVEGGV